MKDPLGVSPSKGNQGTTRGKEKFLLTSVRISPVPELSFLPTPHRGWTRARERRVQDNLHAHAQNAAIFPPKSEEKPYLVLFSRFGLWRDFLNDNIEATISVFRLIKNMSINPNQWNFTCTTLNHIRFVCLFVFFYHNIKDNERNLCKICWQLKTPTRTWKCTPLHYANELLVRVRLSIQNFCKIAQHTETIRKQCLAKE